MGEADAGGMGAPAVAAPAGGAVRVPDEPYRGRSAAGEIVNCQFSIKQRCDAVVYDRRMQPLMLIECKAETVPLTQKTLDQAVTYNRKLGVPWLVLHNGIQTITINCTSGNNTYITGLPRYTHLLRGE